MATALIELKDVNRTYKVGDEELHALNGVSLTIQPGQFVAITGPSGSGKSTLANVIGGLDRVDSGSVMIDGEEIAKMRDRKLSEYRNKHIGFVFQSFNLQPNMTALENVMMPMVFAGVKPKERKEIAKQCLEAVGLGDRMDHRPTELSGGQRQRVSIARALANKPSIIIADEPTGNLDSKRGQEIMSVLKDLNKQGITLLVITHDAAIAKMADRVLAIHDGKMTEARV